MRNVPVTLSHFPGCLLRSHEAERHPSSLISCRDSQQGMMGEIQSRYSLFPLPSFPISALLVRQSVLAFLLDWCLSVVLLFLINLSMLRYLHTLIESLLWDADFCIVIDRLTGGHGCINVSVFRHFNRRRPTAHSVPCCPPTRSLSFGF